MIGRDALVRQWIKKEEKRKPGLYVITLHPSINLQSPVQAYFIFRGYFSCKDKGEGKDVPAHSMRAYEGLKNATQ